MGLQGVVGASYNAGARLHLRQSETKQLKDRRRWLSWPLVLAASQALVLAPARRRSFFLESAYVLAH